MKKMLNTLIIGVVFVASTFGGYVYWEHQRRHPSTKDAQVHANIIQIAAQVSGKVSAIHVKNEQIVNKDAPLFDIDPASFEQALIQAKAHFSQVKQALESRAALIKKDEAVVREHRATLLLAEKNAQRTLKLVKKKLVSQATADETSSRLTLAKEALAVAIAQLKGARATLGNVGKDNPEYRAAKAAIDKARFDVEHTHIVAPARGYVTQFRLRIGSNVVANTPLFALVENESRWVIAKFKETQLERIKVGQPATITLDMYPNRVFKGAVEHISSCTETSFSLLPPEDATGNWVKVTQRFPVKIKIYPTKSAPPLRVGASCTVSVDTTQDKPA